MIALLDLSEEQHLVPPSTKNLKGMHTSGRVQCHIKTHHILEKAQQGPQIKQHFKIVQQI